MADLLDQGLNKLLVGLAGEVQDLLGNVGVTLARAAVTGVPLDGLAQVHGVGAAVDDVAVLERGAGLVGHGVHDAQQARGEGDAGNALGLVHVLAGVLVAGVGDGQPLVNLADAVQGVGVGEHGRRGGDVGLQAVGQRVHAGVRAQLGGHAVGELGVNNGHVGRDLEVSDGVLDALVVVRDDGERGDLRRGAGGGADGAEVGLLAQLRDAEDLAHVLEGALRVLVLDPHGLGRVDGRAAADGNNPVRAEGLHGRGALHDGLHGRIGLDALEQLDLHAGSLEVGLDVLQEAAAAHAAAAGDDHGLVALEVLDLVAGTLAKVQITRIGETTHNTLLTIHRRPGAGCLGRAALATAFPCETTSPEVSRFQIIAQPTAGRRQEPKNELLARPRTKRPFRLIFWNDHGIVVMLSYVATARARARRAGLARARPWKLCVCGAAASFPL